MLTSQGGRSPGQVQKAARTVFFELQNNVICGQFLHWLITDH
jgi:hypothetical protein